MVSGTLETFGSTISISTFFSPTVTVRLMTQFYLGRLEAGTASCLQYLDTGSEKGLARIFFRLGSVYFTFLLYISLSHSLCFTYGPKKCLLPPRATQ